MLKLMFESVMVPGVLQVLSWTVSIGVKDLTVLHELTLMHLFSTSLSVSGEVNGDYKGLTVGERLLCVTVCTRECTQWCVRE